MGVFERALQGLEEVWSVLEGLAECNADKARCLWQIGTAYWDMSGESRSLDDVNPFALSTSSSTRSLPPHRENSYRYLVSTDAPALLHLLPQMQLNERTRIHLPRLLKHSNLEADTAKIVEGFGEDCGI
jgi:hypothetical protein